MSVLNQKMDEQMPYFKRAPGVRRGRERETGLRKWAWGVTHAAAAARAETLKLERRKVCYRYRAEGEGGRVGRRGDHG